MNSQLFCVFGCVFKLVCKQCRVFIWKPPFLFAVLAVILSPSLLQAATLKPAYSSHDSNVTLVMDSKAGFKDGKSINAAGSGGQGGNVSSKRLDESGASGGLAGFKVVAPINIPNIASQQNSAKNGIDISSDEFNHWWVVYVLIALSPLLFSGNAGPYGGLKPNVKAKATRARTAPANDHEPRWRAVAFEPQVRPLFLDFVAGAWDSEENVVCLLCSPFNALPLSFKNQLRLCNNTLTSSFEFRCASLLVVN